jgi:hypothetical protein
MSKIHLSNDDYDVVLEVVVAAAAAVAVLMVNCSNY